MFLPSHGLTPCVRGYLSRRTVSLLAFDERCNHFAATPTCVVVWVLRGHDSRLEDAGRPRLPVVFGGPHAHPSISHNPGPVHFFTMLIYPDALRAMTGIDVASHVDRYCAFDTVFPPSWQGMARMVFDAADDAARIDVIEDFLLREWAAVQPSGALLPQKFSQWCGGVATRAAHAPGGISERQVDRRIKAWTGQALRQLHRVARIENALLMAGDGRVPSQADWSAIAAACGFSDQAHLCREFRRVTDSPPQALKRIAAHESHWLYRVWVL